MNDATAWPDLASRALGGSVIHANDELFAARENLIQPGAPVFDPHRFGPRGKVYDGWETRRRREPGSDFAVIRLAVPAVVHAVVVDTAWFTGNYPPEVSVDAAALDGYPSVGEVLDARWVPLVGRSPVKGDTANTFTVDEPHRFTHVRLTIHPDGGVARLRVHGAPVPHPDLLTGTIDLAALELGGEIVDCSDMYYASARNLLMPGHARHTGEGWENARRRDQGNDFVTVRLAGQGTVRRVVLDTTHFLGNAPGEVRLRGADLEAGSAEHGPAEHGPAEHGSAQHALGDLEGWPELLPRTRVQPDVCHQLPVQSEAPVTHVRLDVYPDGGMSRMRVLGELTEHGMAAVDERYRATRPD